MRKSRISGWMGRLFGCAREAYGRHRDAAKRGTAMLLAAAVTVTGIQFPSFAETEYANELDGWTVQTAWSTLTKDYVYDSVKDERRQPKMVVVYKKKNAEVDYNPGDITITIPGIGGSNRESVVKASDLAADKPNSEWSYTWDRDTDLYTFKNKFTVKAGESVSGGFEIMWTLGSRSSENGYYQDKSPTFSIEGKGTILLEPLTYSFTSARDRYNLSMSKSNLTSTEWKQSDKNYVYYKFSTRFSKDLRARGLYRSSYFVSVELPDMFTDEDYAAVQVNKTGRLEKIDGVWGFYPFRDRSGDLGSGFSDYTNTFELGFLGETLNEQNVTVRGHLDRLYQDDEDWTTEAMDSWENVDTEKTFTVEKYEFVYQEPGEPVKPPVNPGVTIKIFNGYRFGMDKLSQAPYETPSSHNAPAEYTSRLNATNLYDGKLVTFDLSGDVERKYRYEYKPAGTLSRISGYAGIASPSDADMGPGMEQEDDPDTVSDGADSEESPNPYSAMWEAQLERKQAVEGTNNGTENAKQPEAEIPEGLSDWNDIHWKEHGLGETSEEPASRASYEDMHPEQIPGIPSRTDSDDEWPYLPDIDLIGKTNILRDLFGGITAYAAGTATPSGTDPDDGMSGNGVTAAPDIWEDILATDSNAIPQEAEREVSGMGENQAYSMILGEDKLAVNLNNGSIRPLSDDEYDVAYVIVPGTGSWELYGSKTQDAAFETYEVIDSGSSYEMVYLPAGYKAVFLRYNDFYGDSNMSMKVGIRLHLDWESEMQKEENDRINHEGEVINYGYFRVLYRDESGVEVCANPAYADNYLGGYGAQLAERDMATYGTYVQRDYSHVWLRNPATEINSMTGLSDFEGSPKSGFRTNIRSGGTISGDNEGDFKRFSLYTIIPEGLYTDLDETGISVTGSGTLVGGNAATSFMDHANIRTFDVDGKTVVAVDFDFTDTPLDSMKPVSIHTEFEATLSYANFLQYHNTYAAETYLLLNDAGLSKLVGDRLRTDWLDLNDNGNIYELGAYSTGSATVDDTAIEWRGYASKYVRSAYSKGYVTDTVTKLSTEGMTEEERQSSLYSYRLDFGLGTSNAKDLVFIDHLEQGASVERVVDGEVTIKDIPSEWQGTLESVDVSKPLSMGMKPTIYYSTDENAGNDVTGPEWQTAMPEDKSSVQSVAVRLDTSGMQDSVMKAGQMTYITINMLAPADASLIEKQAVNQYAIDYIPVNLFGEDEDRETLPSSETYVRLLDRVGRAVLQKVDADHVVNHDKEGSEIYASLTGAVIQVYKDKEMTQPLFTDEDGNPAGKEVSSLGRIVLNNIRQGTYYWKEIKAPAGYVLDDTLHELAVDGIGEITYLKNYRIRGEVTLTKRDQDDQAAEPLAGAEYMLYRQDGEQVYLKDGSYAPDGTESTVTTGEDGTLTVRNLPWGTYYFVEVKAPDGYDISNSKIYFEVGKAQYDPKTDRVYTQVDGYDYEKTANILLKKTDSSSGRPVRGAVYSLYKAGDGSTGDIRILSDVKTNAVGEIQANGLKFGRYYFVETRNADGYLMPQGDAAKTETVVLDRTTVSQTVKVSHTNDRRTGSVNLLKKDDAGQLVGGAVYELWHKSDLGAAEFTLLGEYTTDNDRLGDTYGEITVGDLAWGEYYFKEVKTPTGYELSPDEIRFTIDRNTVQNQVYVNAFNNRMRGSVTLTKVEKGNETNKLAGAVYELYRTDGTKCVAGTDYTLPDGVTSIVTGTDGTITLTGIPQGGYYFKEVTAPADFSLSDEYIRFSITKNNAAVVQQLTAADERGRATITINKEIDACEEAFGDPTFVFEVIRDDGMKYMRSITLGTATGSMEGSVSLTVDQGHTYTIREIAVSRYKLVSVTTSDEGTAILDNEKAVTILSATDTHGEAAFVNHLKRFDKVSHAGNATNMIKASAKLVGIGVEYTGPDPIISDLPGYDAYEEIYTFPEEDVIVRKFYDDGTEIILNRDEYSLNPPTVDGSTNSYTGIVSYTENGVTYTDSFSVAVDLPQPLPRHTVNFVLGADATIVVGGSAQSTYEVKVKDGRELTKPENDPVRPGYIFKGWFEDAAYTTEMKFPYTVNSDMYVYAKWEREAIHVKYAVSIYGIEQDTDADGNTVGLTFGPATGANHTMGNGVEHTPTPESDQICMHNQTWAEIIEQCADDPSVYRECMENGCTHAVELSIAGPLSEKATGYPNMTGDGASVLYSSVNPAYRKWNREKSTYFAPDSNEYIYGTNQGGWADSAIRNTLNGVTTANMLQVTNKDNGFANAYLTNSNCLLAAFPDELQNAIVAKAVKSDSVYNDTGSTVTTYDKLWLMSGKEFYGDSGSDNFVIRPNEGDLYQRQQAFGITTGNYSKAKHYNESGTPDNAWLRSVGQSYAGSVCGVDYAGDWYYNDVRNTGYGLAPCFCLSTMPPDVKYAVSVYGIEVDEYEGGGTDKAGLTFGPATGADYNEDYVSRGHGGALSHDGTTAGETPHLYRCIHEDSWATIAEWSKTDPYVYEKCIGDATHPSCTKAVPLRLSDKLKVSKPLYTNIDKNGDGASTLYFAVDSLYRMWNYGSSNTGGWPESRIRSTLNGWNENDPNKPGTNAWITDINELCTEEDSLFAAFPIALKSAIVKKAVKSDTVFNDMTEANLKTTYDRLWLFSPNEYFANPIVLDPSLQHPLEGSPYPRQTARIVNNAVLQARLFSELSAAGGWLRSVVYQSYSSENTIRVGSNNSNGYAGYNYTNYSYGLSPGFSLK